MQTSTGIAKVIESCLDDERTLVRMSRLVDARRSAVLTQLADERRRFSEELEQLTAPIGRGNLGSWSALVRELGANLRARLVGRTVGDVMETCRRSQHRTDLRYEKTLTQTWPNNVKAALIAQHVRVHSAADELARIAN